MDKQASRSPSRSPGRSPGPSRSLSASSLLPLSAALVALCGRLLVLTLAPAPYAFDAFQRWAGRDHVLVRDWLPATQAVVVSVAAAGGSHLQARLALAVVAALGMAGGAVVARRIGGPVAGWLFVPVGLFGPALCWTSALYQEGTFLAVLLVGLSLALRARADQGAWLWADLVVGLLGLVRYEGWPVVILYVFWRGQRGALVASWGAGLWLLLRSIWPAGYAPSPVDYADWAGLDQRFGVAPWLHSASRLLGQAWASGGLVVVGLGVLGAILALRHRRTGAGLLVLITLSQLAAVAGWMAGLETAIVRMQVVVVTLAGLLAAVGLGPWVSAGRCRRSLALVVGLLAAAGWCRDGVRLGQRAERGVRWEQDLVERLGPSGPGGLWTLSPRRGLGTRSRHDGCEIVEGLTRWQHGEDFLCETWPAVGRGAAGAEEPVLRVTWAKGGYQLVWLR